MASLKDLNAAVSKKLKTVNPDIIFDSRRSVEFLSSGCMMFDIVAGGGVRLAGLPKGRITEVFGAEHSCKTTLGMTAAAGVQRREGVGIILDFEQAFDPDYARNTCGLEVDNKYITVFQPENLEQGGDILDLIASLDRLDFLFCDSIDAMKPKAWIEGALSEERRMGAQAQGIARFIAKLKPIVAKKNIAMLFSNQVRTQINTSKFVKGMGTGAGFEAFETLTTPGGYAPRFYASLRMKFEYGGQQTEEVGNNIITGEQEKSRIGNMIRIINVKNKVSSPFLKAETHFDFPTLTSKGGFNESKDILAILKKRGRAKQQATKFSYDGLRESFSRIGGKVESETLFMTNEILQADAKALILNLIAGGSGKEEGFTSQAVPGVDFSKEDITDSARTESISLTTLVAEEIAMDDNETQLEDLSFSFSGEDESDAPIDEFSAS